jgi:NAD(P)-dependent dehydrogenase (short-subunit alcohol dehydrogenase family)
MTRLSDLFSLKGRVALVTGGSGFLAAAIGEALVELGARVVLTDRDERLGLLRCDQLNEHAGSAVTSFIAADLLDESSTRELVKETAAREGRLDILIHNAAYTGATGVAGWGVPFDQQTVEAWDQGLRVNLTSAFILAQEAAPLLAANPGSAILFVGSIYGVLAPQFSLYEGTSMANPAAYNASKAGLIQLGRYLATALAPTRVNCICPGGIERGQPEEFVSRYSSRTPLARMAREDDFKGAVAFLCSSASAYVTGQTLMVDGGWSSW